MLRRLAPALGLFVGAHLAACAAPDEDHDVHADAFTVESGDRFVVSARPDEVVLLRRVGEMQLPFDDRSLVGKAVLVHPVAGRAEDGVYARVLSAEPRGDRFVLRTEPLALEEMETISEDAIVRIYLDRARAGAHRHGPDGLGPQAVADLLAPSPLRAQTGHGWFAGHDFDGLPFLGLGKVGPVKPGVVVDHDVKSLAFAPEVLVDWERETGLVLGLRGSLTWSSTVAVEGAIGGEIFRSPSVATPPLVVFVPIGPALVPVTLRARAQVACWAVVAGAGRFVMDVDAQADVGASMYVRQRRGAPPSEWVREGPWPAHASGTASATVAVATAPVHGKLECSLPRVDLDALVAGVAGPFVGFAPMAILDSETPGGSMRVDVFAGVAPAVAGAPYKFERRLYQWRP